MGFIKVILAVASILYGYEAGNDIRRRRKR